MLTGVRAGVRLGRFPNCVVDVPIFELAVTAHPGRSGAGQGDLSWPGYGMAGDNPSVAGTRVRVTEI
jgi:hypothetical protein